MAVDIDARAGERTDDKEIGSVFGIVRTKEGWRRLSWVCGGGYVMGSR